MTAIEKKNITNSTLQIFQQKDATQKVIRQHTMLATGLGFLPIPILDTISITSIQILMIRDIAKIYGIPFEKQRVKSFVSSLLGNLGIIGFFKFIPILGSVFGGSFVSLSAGAITYALGHVFMEHFNQGGTLLDFNPIKSRAYFLKIYKENEKIEMELKASNQDKNIVMDIQQLQYTKDLKKENERLLEEETLHTELHQEAEELIIEFRETLREQENQNVAKIKEQIEAILNLEENNKSLRYRITHLQEEIQKQNKLL